MGKHVHSIRRIAQQTVKHVHSIRRIAQNTVKHVHSIRRMAQNTVKHVHSIRRIAQNTVKHVHSIRRMAQTYLFDRRLRVLKHTDRTLEGRPRTGFGRRSPERAQSERRKKNEANIFGNFSLLIRLAGSSPPPGAQRASRLAHFAYFTAILP